MKNIKEYIKEDNNKRLVLMLPSKQFAQDHGFYAMFPRLSLTEQTSRGFRMTFIKSQNK